MEYYRSNIAGGITPTNQIDATNTILNSASDSYTSNYWNIPYSDGLSPMKQIEGKKLSGRKSLTNELRRKSFRSLNETAEINEKPEKYSSIFSKFVQFALKTWKETLWNRCKIVNSLRSNYAQAKLVI